MQWKRASSGVEAGTSGFLSISDSDRRVPAELGQEKQASSCVEVWNSACRSSYSRGDRPLVELYLEPTGFYGRCTGVSVPLRFSTSSTRLYSKRCPGIRFLSRADREIGVFRNVAPPTRLHLEFLCETGLILRCDGNVGELSGSHQGCQVPLRPSRRNVGLLLRCCSQKVLHLAMKGKPRGFSRVEAGFSNYNGEFRMPLVLAQGSPSFNSSCEGELGIDLESLQGK